MTQTTYNLPNQPGAAVRASINSFLQAIVTQNSGPNAPDPTYANMMWFNTANDTMYMRNEANNAWIAMYRKTTNKWQLINNRGANVPSAVVLNLGADGNYFEITGNSNITGITPIADGIIVKLYFTQALTLIHSPTFQLPEASNIQVQAGDTFEFVQIGNNVWRSATSSGGGGGARLDQPQVWTARQVLSKGTDLTLGINPLLIPTDGNFFQIAGTTGSGQLTNLPNINDGATLTFYVAAQVTPNMRFVHSDFLLLPNGVDVINPPIGTVLQFTQVSSGANPVWAYTGGTLSESYSPIILPSYTIPATFATVNLDIPTYLQSVPDQTIEIDLLNLVLNRNTRNDGFSPQLEMRLVFGGTTAFTGYDANSVLASKFKTTEPTSITFASPYIFREDWSLFCPVPNNYRITEAGYVLLINGSIRIRLNNNGTANPLVSMRGEGTAILLDANGNYRDFRDGGTIDFNCSGSFGGPTAPATTGPLSTIRISTGDWFGTPNPLFQSGEFRLTHTLNRS